jgi:PAS domain S-box-containing protein
MTPPENITTIAGNGTPAYSAEGNPAIRTRLIGPTGVCLDANGHLYIAEYWNHRVRKIDLDGTITTVAGNGSPAYSGDGGPATRASLFRPHGVFIDSTACLYIADHQNNRIRRVDPDGIITTVAGNGIQGFSGDGGPAIHASLYHPATAFTTSRGELYIVDQANHRIRKVDPEGTITTVVGNGSPGYSGDGGPATQAGLQLPRGACLDAEGRLYIADFLNHRVRRVDPDGIITTVVGSGEPGSSGDGESAIQARVWFPGSVLVDANSRLYIAERGNSHRIRRVAPDGTINTVAGCGFQGFSGDGGPATQACMSQPNDLCLNPAGSLFVADWGNGRARKIAPNGIITTIAGCELDEVPGLEDGIPALRANIEPSFVFVAHTDEVYFVESARHRIRKIGSEGTVRTVAGNGRMGFSGDGGPATQASMHRPVDCFASGDDSIYIADFMNHRIRKVDPHGIITTIAGNGQPDFSGDGGSALGASLNHPRHVFIDAEDCIYISDVANHRVRKIDPGGIITTIAGSGAPAPFGIHEACDFSGEGGPAMQATLHPGPLFVDGKGSVYISSPFNHRVFKIDPSGIIITIAGNGQPGFAGDGKLAVRAQLNSPTGLFVDGAGSVYIADVLNHCIRRVDPDGIITTIAGDGQPGFTSDGGSPIRFRHPGSLFVDRRGDLFVTDGGNHRIHRISDIATSTELPGATPTLHPPTTADERQRQEPLHERLHRIEETHEAILNSIADGVFTVDHEWRITSFNRAAERITGLRSRDLLGQFCRRVLDSDRCREGCPLALTLEQNRNLFDYEVALRHQNDSPCNVRANTAVLYDRQGNPAGGVVTFRDPARFERLGEEAETVPHFEGLIGQHPSMMAIYDLIAEVADSDATVLILGDSGTGKEMIANALVRRGSRSDCPFVKVNCSAFPETLLESELFGHVRGAFTDARSDRIGRFEKADGGTIFLDEVGEIPLSSQVKLLRVLEEGTFERLGSSDTLQADVRVIAATNQDLPHQVRDRRFRDDLYYRLNVIPILLPPLRERRDDIPLLLDHFLAKYRRLTKKLIGQISDQAMDLFLGYDYPGNVRELENAVEHAFARTAGNIITEQKLPLALQRQIPAGELRSESSPPIDAEKQRILQALNQAHWNRNQAAQLLGMSRVTLWRRMKTFEIEDR